MRYGLRRAVLAIAFAGVPGVVGAQTTPLLVKFDDVPTTLGNYFVPMPQDYNGFTWSGFTVANGAGRLRAFGDYGFLNNTVSPANVAVAFGVCDESFYTCKSTISRATPFTFFSGYFGAGLIDGYGMNVSGTLNGQSVFSRFITLGEARPTFVTFGTDGAGVIVDNITFTKRDPTNQPVMDNLSFAVSDATTTPEPTSLALLGTGLVGLVPIARRRKRA